MTNGKFEIEFIKSGRGKAQCPPNPDYPEGVTIHGEKKGMPFCTTSVPYPAPECGHFSIVCTQCHIEVVVTTAGRPDDPRLIYIPCLTAPGVEEKDGKLAKE